MDAELLTRDAFREAVFERDKHTCVACSSLAVDAHHIMERRLWPDGGYYLDNGASLCAYCHMMAEVTSLSTQNIRRLAKIDRVLLPPQLYPDVTYDKWANECLANGKRLPGPLFHDASVRKVLGPYLDTFDFRRKYPRTLHLPWSESVDESDRVLEDLSYIGHQDVVVTVKYDGENTTMYQNGIHSRSLDFRGHPTRDWVKALHNRIAHDIPAGWRICGENLWAAHSIHYKHLPAFFIAFSLWDSDDICFSWDDTLEWFELLGLTPPKVLYEGPFDEQVLRKLYTPTVDGDGCEGYVVRPRRMFAREAFHRLVAKYVRKNHVRTHARWMNSRIICNELHKEGKGDA